MCGTHVHVLREKKSQQEDTVTQMLIAQKG